MNELRIALVTGASRGFGRSMAGHLAAAGVKVIGTYHRGDAEAEELSRQVAQSGGTVSYLRLDVTRTDTFESFTGQVAGVLADWGAERFDYLVNNAGVGTFLPYPETTESVFDHMMAVNVKGPYVLTQHLLPLLKDAGRILNISTALTRSVVPGGSAYAASKGAVEVLTRYQAIELAGRGIRVNTVMGGATASDFGDGIMHTEAVRALSAKSIALGRIGTPDDLAAAVPLILSDAFAWANGGCIELTGGQGL